MWSVVSTIKHHNPVATVPSPTYLSRRHNIDVSIVRYIPNNVHFAKYPQPLAQPQVKLDLVGSELSDHRDMTVQYVEELYISKPYQFTSIAMGKDGDIRDYLW